MTQSKLSEMLSRLRSISAADLQREIAAPEAFILDRCTSRNTEYTEVWAPFDHINSSARIAIVGLTPGRQQMEAALLSCRAALMAGHCDAEALRAAKAHASFAGSMRRNLVALLDDLGVTTALGIRSSTELWGPAGHLIHFTSALRYPIFRNGENWSGTPGPLRLPMLVSRIESTLVQELSHLREDCRIIPLGTAATTACLHAAKKAGIARGRILDGLPHPSGANGERIALFLGRKPASEASGKSDPARLLSARARLHVQMQGDF